MLEVAKASYQRTIGRLPDVRVSVCSLDLGMFTQRIDGLDTIGIGTNLHDLHSPKEHMDHTSATRVWPLIKDVMRHLDGQLPHRFATCSFYRRKRPEHVVDTSGQSVQASPFRPVRSRSTFLMRSSTI